MAEQELVDALASLISRVQADEEWLLAGLSEEERAAPGTIESWSAKDLVAHVTSWHEHLAGVLAAALAGTTPQSTGEIDQFNAANFAERHGRPWRQVEAEATAAFDRLLELIPQLTDDDLRDADRYPWRRRRPLGVLAFRAGYWHPETHFSEFYVQRGKIDEATRTQQDLLRAADRLPVAPEVRGLTLYSLARFYATTGQPDEAIANLQEAISLVPRMAEAARREPDLAPLRSDPRFRALGEGGAT